MAPSSSWSASSLASASICLRRCFAVSPRVHTTIIGLLELGYKCRLRLPLFISATFVLCHVFANYIPRIEINVQFEEEVAAAAEEEDDDAGEDEPEIVNGDYDDN